MSILIFILIFSYLYLFGSFLSTKLLKSKKSDLVKEFPNYIFYPIVSLFFLGNLLFLLNFIFPLDVFIVPLIIVTFTISIFSKLTESMTSIEVNINWLFSNFVVPIILSVSLYGSRFHFDSMAYHIGYQNWIRTEKIVFGLSVRNYGFGFSSILEYLYSIFWFDDNLLYIYSINLVFFILLINFIYFGLLSANKIIKSTSFFIATFLFLDNFGIGGGANGSIKFQTVAKPDMPMSILFLIVCLIMFYRLHDKYFEINDLKVILFMIFFSYQIKVNAILSIFLFMIYLYRFSKNKELDIFNILKNSKTLFFLSFFWTLKSFILSGCLIFPLGFTCLKGVNWYVNGYIEEYFIGDLNNSILNSDSLFSWYEVFINTNLTYQIINNFYLSTIALVILSFIITQKHQNRDPLFYLFYFSLVFIWLITEPKLRWASHIFMLTILLITYGRKLKPFYENILNKYIILSIVIVTCLLLPRVHSYQALYENKLSLTTLNIPKIQYEQNSFNSGVLAIENNLKNHKCYANKLCMLNDKDVAFEEIFSYKFFYYKGFNTW